MQTGAQSRGDKAFDILNAIILLLILVMVIYPLYFIIIASVSDPVQVMSGKVRLLPIGVNLDGYVKIFQDQLLWRSYWNTIVYTIVGLAINMILTTLGAFPLSRKTLPGRRIFLILIMFTMYFNGGLIPTYILVKNLHMTNTLWALVLPGAISVFNLIIMRSFFQQFPEEILEAASIEGCSAFRSLLQIVLPLSVPVVSVLILYYGVAHWNDYFNGLIYMSDRNKYPLQLVLRNILIQSQQSTELSSSDDSAYHLLLLSESIKYGVIIVSTLPVMMLYPFMQKYFVKGVMLGAVKG